MSPLAKTTQNIKDGCVCEQTARFLERNSELTQVKVDIPHVRQRPELRNRILATLGLLAIFRVGFWGYLPGINIAQFKSLLADDEGPLNWLTMTSKLTGGSFTPVLFSLGIMPYISASIIFSLLVNCLLYTSPSPRD